MSQWNRGIAYCALILATWCASCATKRTEPPPLGEPGETELMRAATLGQSNVVESLLAEAKDKNLDERDWAGRTPLMLAALTGQVDIVDILLAHGAHPDARDDSGWTALAFAAERGHAAIVDTLYQHGADFNASMKADRLFGRRDVTVLMVAASAGHTKIVTNLIHWGARVNMRDWNGYTAFMYACCRGHLETAKTLLANGAEASVVSEDGKTPMIVAMLDRQEHTDIVTNLIQWGADVNARDKHGWTALMFACGRGYLASAGALLAAGADASVKSVDGKTALTLAEQSQNSELVFLLKQKLGG